MMDELGLNFFIRSRNKDSQITWEYEVWIIETGNLICAGRDISDEIKALKEGISAVIEIKIKEFKIKSRIIEK